MIPSGKKYSKSIMHSTPTGLGGVYNHGEQWPEMRFGEHVDKIMGFLREHKADNFPFSAGAKLHISKKQAELLFQAGFDLNGDNVIVYHRNKSIYWDQFIGVRTHYFKTLG